MSAEFARGLSLSFSPQTMDFNYGEGVFGPLVERRALAAIRSSLLDPACDGPDPVYAIAMDVGREEHREVLQRMAMLYGVVAYAPGQLGMEPVRSQGHVHAVSPRCGWSTPELIEVWQGEALVYLQEFVADETGRCRAIRLQAGQHVVIPPGWGHFVAAVSVNEALVFGALCTRDYAFEYADVRARGGLAWFPVMEDGRLGWKKNPKYLHAEDVVVTGARSYSELGLVQGRAIYEQFADEPARMQWIAEPGLCADVWARFEP